MISSIRGPWSAGLKKIFLFLFFFYVGFGKKQIGSFPPLTDVECGSWP